METNDSDTLALGGNIQLSGFKDVDHSEMIVVKKLVGSYARKFSDRHEKFQSMHVNLKHVHKREKSEIFEITGRVILDGNAFSVDHDDRNLFFCIDSVMKKLELLVEKE
jgi:ribosome-associated translation inhibitor RaiA